MGGTSTYSLTSSGVPMHRTPSVSPSPLQARVTSMLHVLPQCLLLIYLLFTLLFPRPPSGSALRIPIWTSERRLFHITLHVSILIAIRATCVSGQPVRYHPTLLTHYLTAFAHTILHYSHTIPYYSHTIPHYSHTVLHFSHTIQQLSHTIPHYSYTILGLARRIL